MIRRLVLALFLVSTCFAGQSLVVTSGNVFNLSDPNLSTGQDWTVEFQILNAGTVGSEQLLIGLNGVGMQAFLEAGNVLRIQDVRDTIGSGAVCGMSISPTANVLVRVVRNTVTNIVSCESWNWDATNYQLVTLTITATPSWIFSNGGIGGGTASFDVGFMRVLKGTQAIGGTPPTTFTSLSNPNLWTELKMDGTLSDSSSNTHNASVNSGAASYTPTPNQTAVPLPKTSVNKPWLLSVPFRAGTTNGLNGAASYTLKDTTATVSCFWNELSGPSTAIFDNHNSCTPNVTGIVFGEYLFILQASDTGGNVATANLTVGAVATDSNHIVVDANQTFSDAVFGQQIAMGYNQFPYADWANQNAVNVVGAQIGAANSGATISDDWNVALSGTCYISGTSPATVTCTGGFNAQNTFCGGGTTWTGTTWLIAWYNDPATGGRVGRLPLQVATCPTTSTMTLDTIDGHTWPYLGTSCTSGAQCQFAASSKWLGAISGIGSFGYYDGATMFEAYHRRTGLSQPATWGSRLSSIELTAPGIDQGVHVLVQPRINTTRQWAVQQVYYPTASNFSAFQLGLRNMATVQSSQFVPPGQAFHAFSQNVNGVEVDCTVYCLNDVRESGASLMDIAAAAYVETDPTWQTTLNTYLEGAWVNAFQPQQQLDGHWDQSVGAHGNVVGSAVSQFTHNSTAVAPFSGTYTSTQCGTLHTSAGTVTITNGSSVIVGSGTSFTSGTTGDFVVIFGNVSGVYNKQMFNIVSITDNTHMTLGQPVDLDSSSTATIGMWASTQSPGYAIAATDNTGAQTVGWLPGNDWYTCTYNGPTSLTLDQPYQNTNTYGIWVVGGGDFYTLNQGTQAYMNAFITAGLKLGSLVGTTHAAQMRTASAGLYPFMSTTAWTGGATKGVYYASLFGSCLPPNPGGVCGGATAQTVREYGLEVDKALADAYLANPTTPIANFLNTYYCAQWGNASFDSLGCSDANFVQDSGIGFTVGANLKFGYQPFALGGAPAIPAALLGGLAPAQNRTVNVPVKLSAVPGSASIQVIVVLPNGATTTNSCSSSPCVITVDDRQGKTRMQILYLSAGNAVLNASDWIQVN